MQSVPLIPIGLFRKVFIVDPEEISRFGKFVVQDAGFSMNLNENYLLERKVEKGFDFNVLFNDVPNQICFYCHITITPSVPLKNYRK